MAEVRNLRKQKPVYTSQVFQMGLTWGHTHWTLDMLRSKSDELKAALDAHCVDYIYQGEKAASGLFHFQGWIKLDYKDRPDHFAKALALPGVHLSPASNAGKAALKLYSMKADTRVIDPVVKNPERVAAEAKKAESKYTGQDLPKDLLPWQANLCDELAKRKPHSRQILWIADPKGGGGKSMFAKYMAFHHGAAVLAWGDSKDVLYSIAKMEQEQGAPRICLFNLTRTKPKLFSSDDLYASLESIKDGMFVSTKYESRTVFMDVPHVVVFANCLPDGDKLSKDRWRIIKLKDEDRVLPGQERKEDHMQLTFGEPWHVARKDERINDDADDKEPPAPPPSPVNRFSEAEHEDIQSWQ